MNKICFKAFLVIFIMFSGNIYAQNTPAQPVSVIDSGKNPAQKAKDTVNE